MKTFFTFLLFFINLHVQAQTSCLRDTSIKTCRVGTPEENFAFPTQFEFTKDSVTMKATGTELSKLVFLIRKSDCTWNENFTQGNSIYEVILKDDKRKASIKVFINPGKQIIELQYESSKELRVFTVCK